MWKKNKYRNPAIPVLFYGKIVLVSDLDHFFAADDAVIFTFYGILHTAYKNVAQNDPVYSALGRVDDVLQVFDIRSVQHELAHRAVRAYFQESSGVFRGRLSDHVDIPEDQSVNLTPYEHILGTVRIGGLLKDTETVYEEPVDPRRSFAEWREWNGEGAADLEYMAVILRLMPADIPEGQGLEVAAYAKQERRMRLDIFFRLKDVFFRPQINVFKEDIAVVAHGLGNFPRIDINPYEL